MLYVQIRGFGNCAYIIHNVNNTLTKCYEESCMYVCIKPRRNKLGYPMIMRRVAQTSNQKQNGYVRAGRHYRITNKLTIFAAKTLIIHIKIINNS